MPPKQKSIQLKADAYEVVVEAAEKCGYTVRRGRGSELAKFVEEAVVEKLRREIKETKSNDLPSL